MATSQPSSTHDILRVDQHDMVSGPPSAIINATLAIRGIRPGHDCSQSSGIWIDTNGSHLRATLKPPRSHLGATKEPPCSYPGKETTLSADQRARGEHMRYCDPDTIRKVLWWITENSKQELCLKVFQWYRREQLSTELRSNLGYAYKPYA